MIDDGILTFLIIFAVSLGIVALHTLYFLALKVWRKDLNPENIDQTDAYNIFGAVMGIYAIIDALFHVYSQQEWAASLPLTVFVMIGFGAYATIRYSYNTLTSIFRKNLFSN